MDERKEVCVVIGWLRLRVRVRVPRVSRMGLRPGKRGVGGERESGLARRQDWRPVRQDRVEVTPGGRAARAGGAQGVEAGKVGWSLVDLEKRKPDEKIAVDECFHCVRLDGGMRSLTTQIRMPA